jgi:hypothetical protein
MALVLVLWQRKAWPCGATLWSDATFPANQGLTLQHIDDVIKG